MSAYFLGGVLCSSVTGALYASHGWTAVCIFGGCVSLVGLATWLTTAARVGVPAAERSVA
jgi:hypothetical protein